MSSIPPYSYSDYMFTNEFCEIPTPMSVGTDGSTTTGSEMHSEEMVPYYDNNGVLINMVSYDSSDITSSISMSMPFLPDRLGVSDMSMAALPDYERGFFGVTAGNEHGFLAGYQHDRSCEFGEECNGLSPNFWPAAYPMGGDNWEIQARMGQKIEDPTLKITRYTAEERKDRILRYLKKRSQRNFNKTIKYACRKTLADKRVRIRGRFAKNNNELCSEEDESVMMKTDQTFQDSTELRFNNINPVQLKAHDEEWLQEAISNLMYYHIFPDNAMELP